MSTPRRVLGEISGNSRRGIELSPYARGEIVRSRNLGQAWKAIKDDFKNPLTTLQSIYYTNPLRNEGVSLPRSGRPRQYDARDERSILRYVRKNPKHTWTELLRDLKLPIGKTTGATRTRKVSH